MSPVRTALFGLLLSVLLVTGCGTVETTPPPPTPANFPDLAGGLALRGLKIDNVVSGDAGCADRTLIPTAISMDASGLDQATTVRLHLYIFGDKETFERLRTTIDDCARSYVTDPETFESVDQSPYVMAGQGPWGQAFEDAIRDGLLKAAGSGG